MKNLDNLIEWSRSSYAYLPWRNERTLYKTLVSEIMLQQTTVSTVLNHFERFLSEFPTIFDLAKTSEEEICIAWKGLGYYRRARNLRKAAIDIVLNFNGQIPLDFESLISITGIGEYTANAILSIGANQKALAIDANLERVLSRVYGVKGKKGPKLQREIRSMFENNEMNLQAVNDYCALNEALMDLGRVFCQARKANCHLCYLKRDCLAYKSGEPLSFPEEPVRKVKKYHELELARFISIKNGKILGYVKSDDQWLSGQIEVPTFVINCSDESFCGYPALEKDFEYTHSIKTTITKYKINNYIQEVSRNEIPRQSKYKYFDIDVKNINFATTTLKILKELNVIK